MGKTDGSSGKGRPISFPGIATEAKLKKIVMCDTSNLVFHDLAFSPDQYATLERWRKNGDPIRMTLEQIQGDLLPREDVE